MLPPPAPPLVGDATDEDMAPYERQGVLPADRFVGDGPYAVARMLEAGVALQVVGPRARMEALVVPAGVQRLAASDVQLGAIHGARYHTGVMALGRIPTVRAVPGPLVVALDGLKDAENVGAIFRTCAAMGVDGVLYSDTCCSPWNRRAVRVSMGGVLRVPSLRVADLPAELRARRAYAAHPQVGAPAPWNVDWRGEVTLVMGAEDVGQRAEVLNACAGAVCIPMQEGWDSLNVGASAAVILAEAWRQRRG
jgi:tRNA G18 (ribose-2'-O)-methylase SpoU